jgi:sporulation protein YlmC with PRC-barrel domain
MTRRIRLHDIVGMRVRDADGKEIGSVEEVKAERRGDTLCITALLIGDEALLSRMGWTDREYGREIPWDRVAAIGSDIVLRRG